MDRESPFLTKYKQNTLTEDSVRPGPVPRKQEPERERVKSKVIPLVVGGIVVVAIILLLVWALNRGIKAEDLTGWKLTDAQTWANENKVNLKLEREFNDEYEVDQIFKQEPKGGSQVEKNGFLTVYVSDGHDLSVTLPLPELTSMTKTQVDQWAAENYMSRVRITTEYHDTIASGRVIRYEINDDTVVDLIKRSTPVYVTVSKGPEPVVVEQVTIPNFKEMALPQAQQFANDNGLLLNLVKKYDDLAPVDTILSQSVAVDAKVDSGSSITLTVSRGKLILVPNFAGLSKQLAAARAQEAGINAVISERYSSRSAGSFISQSLSAGSEYTSGTMLELTYSLGNKIVVSSYIGQPRAALESWITELNANGAGLRVSVTETQNTAPKGNIIQQDPANSVVAPGASIQITVSKGKMIFVPQLVAPAGSDYSQAITRDQAEAACEELGLVPVFRAETKSGHLPGEIWSQSIAPGKDVYQGTTIILKYNPANVTTVVPDFNGQTKEQVIAAGHLKKLKISFTEGEQSVPGQAGKIVAQSVTAGKTVAAGTPITLTISPAEVTLPSESTEMGGTDKGS
ncbi:MAG: PASTA domain-containing protein [Saccharofermentanales bacterium]|jgi:beta-lactam-binding protein with PASTA domain